MQLKTEKNDGCILFVVHGFGEEGGQVQILAKSEKAETLSTSHCINKVSRLTPRVLISLA